MTTNDRPVPVWRQALHAAIQDTAPPPVGTVAEIEESRDGNSGYCHECGDAGAAVTITTQAQPDPDHAPARGQRQRFVWCQAVYPRYLEDLLDAVEAGTLALTWTKHTI